MLHKTNKKIKPQVFLPESNKQCEQFREQRFVKFRNQKTSTKEDAKQFYANVLKTCSKKKNIQNCTKKSEVYPQILQHPHNRHQNLKNSDLFRLAQNNDINNLKNFLEQNKHFDIDIVNDFHWTPLMCASFSGAEKAVKILLENGADPHKSDKMGNTSIKLAKAKHFEKIVRLLENKNELDYNIIVPIKKSSESIYCSICNDTFTMDRNKHESSILHLFNSKYELPTTYGIPESNKGFQLLLKIGWNKNTGLGCDEKGRKLPVKVKVKTDKTGIGVSNSSNMKKPFHNLKYQNKKINSFNRIKEKNMEINFRREFL